MMMKTYKKTDSANACGTYRIGEIIISPKELRELIGNPHQIGDGYKTSGEWIFISNEGEVFTIHDWKATCLYNDNYEDLWDFWESDEDYEFSIGGLKSHNLEAFINWLEKYRAK